MSRGFPSMTALLGLLAVAGYQNRDKLAELLRGATGGGDVGGAAPGQAGSIQGGQAQSGGGLGGMLGGSGGLGGLLGGAGGGGLGSLLGGAAAGGGLGGLLGGGLNDLVDQFKRNGQGDVADSWVGTGANREVSPQDLERGIGSDVLASLEQQTGMSKDELLARLSRELPNAVDKYTPDGRLPQPHEF